MAVKAELKGNRRTRNGYSGHQISMPGSELPDPYFQNQSYLTPRLAKNTTNDNANAYGQISQSLAYSADSNPSSPYQPPPARIHRTRPVSTPVSERKFRQYNNHDENMAALLPDQQNRTGALRRARASDVHADVSRECQTEEEKMQDPEYRKKVRWTKRAGHTLAVTIASIDGVVTAMAVGGVAFLAAGGIPLAILIGVCGFLVNRVVYWRSVPDMLRQLFVDGFFNGLSKIKKVLISISLIFAATLGAGFAALAFKSLCMIMSLTMATAFAVNPPLAILITFLSMCYFLANTSLFFYTLSNNIRRDGHKRAWAFLKNLFKLDPSKSKLEQGLTSVFQIIFTLAGFALGIIAAYAILGKLSNSLGEVLIGTTGASKEAAMIASKVVVFGLASVARFAFSIESAVGAFCKLGRVFASLIYNTGWVLTHWSKAKPMLKATWTAFKDKQRNAVVGQSWDQSWHQWNDQHVDIFKNGSTSERLRCYNSGFKNAFGNLGWVKKAAWFVGGVWFLIHIPAIVVNAVGVLALGAGGGTHIHDISHKLGINVSLHDATTEAMVSAGLFSGCLGLFKYLDLKNKNNDGTKKPSRELNPLRNKRQNEHASPSAQNGEHPTNQKTIYTSDHYRLRHTRGSPSRTGTPAPFANYSRFSRPSTPETEALQPLLARG